MKPSKKKRKVWKWVLLALAATGIYFYRDVLEANMAYASNYELAKSEGAMVTADDLRKRYGASDSENAGPLLQQLRAKWEAEPENLRHERRKAFQALLGVPWPKPKGTQISLPSHEMQIKALEESEKVVEGLDDVLSKPKCDFHYEWERGTSLALPEFTFLKEAAQLCAARGTVLVNEGKAVEAAHKFRLALHIGKLTGDTPCLFASLVQCAINSIATRSIESALRQRPTDAALRQEIRSLMADFSEPIDPIPPLDGELFFTSHCTLHIEELTEGLAEDPPFASKVPGVVRAWQSRAFASCLRRKREMVIMNHDPVRGVGIMRDSAPSDSQGLSYYLLNVLDPVLSQSMIAFVRDIVHRDLLLCTLDVLDARQKNGAWPKTLPVPRRDPFGSKMLNYEVRGERVRIWSIGQDYKDSRGRTKNEENDSDDILVEL